jgi:hypothetical protein
MKIDTVNVEDKTLKQCMYNYGTTWIFNSPHASHFGGEWESMIGVARKILDSMLLESVNRNLTHDILSTLMAELSAIVNSRTLASVSIDSDSPFVLSHNVLLTQKLPNPSCDSDYGNFSIKDMLKSEWKRVQGLADQFWSRWKRDYLNLLQPHRKWSIYKRWRCCSIKGF